MALTSCYDDFDFNNYIDFIGGNSNSCPVSMCVFYY